MAHRDLIRENAWVFDHQPAAEEIEPLLKTVPAWHGSEKTMDEYANFVISISGKLGKEQEFRTVWRLYTTVAGKIAILHDAHRDENGKPTPIMEHLTIEHKAGLIIVSGTMDSPIYGSVFEVGTGVTAEDAKGADKTNPAENAMTSWRGRAASALCGAGILPYTGIASAEEIQTAENRETMYRVVTPETYTPREEGRTNPAAKALESIKRNQQWDDDAAEQKAAEFLQVKGIPHEGMTATEYILSTGTAQTVTDMLVWVKKSKQQK